MEFVIQVRLKTYACCATSLKSVLEISNQVGFNNLSNFSTPIQALLPHDSQSLPQAIPQGTKLFGS